MKLFDIRWKWFKRPIHLVAHLLHLMWREEATFINPELMDAWMSYVEKLYSTLECDVLFRELHEYRNGTGTFSYALAREERSMMTPVTWWENFGGRTPKLQALAIRILSQVSVKC